MADAQAEEEWASLDDLMALHTAPDVGELHRRLLCFSDGGGNKADASEPWCLFGKVHADEPESAVDTALLLLTDRRWRNATGRLVRRIEESGLLSDEQLDVLAHTFLAAGRQLYWEVPADWFTGPTIVFETSEPDDVDPTEVEDEDADDGPVVFARDVRPPLLRWAARRAIGSDSRCWNALVQRARQIDPRGGAAIIEGVVDAAELLSPAARDAVIDVATSWPHRRLREVASALRHPREPAPADDPAWSTIRRGPEPPGTQPSLF